MVVGDAAVVKLFVRTSAGPQPAMDLPAHLAAVGFAETPGSIGALVWDGDVLLATAAAYLSGARDGWEWYPELVLDALDGLAPIDPGGGRRDRHRWARRAAASRARHPVRVRPRAGRIGGRVACGSGPRARR